MTRETADLDAFVAARPGSDPGTVSALADAFAAAAQGRGWDVECARRNLTFCRYVVIFGDETTEVDLAVDSPPIELPEAVDGLPVLTSLDLGGRKVLTIVDRLEARDYADLHALAGILGRRTCIEAALSIDSGIRVGDVADAFARVTWILDERFPAGADEAAAIKRYFTDWADDLGAT
ncbi:MAG: nucleotidyl transferase AbiEii/AbiGii toxin family protein [Acidimicrobiales bacterium]